MNNGEWMQLSDASHSRESGNQTAFTGKAVVAPKAVWIPARAPLGRNDGASARSEFPARWVLVTIVPLGFNAFTTYPEKNPTLTIMALAVRTARYIVDEVKRLNLRA